MLGDARYVFIWNTDARWCPICIYLGDGRFVVQMYIYLDYGRLVVPCMFFIWNTDTRWCQICIYLDYGR